MVNAPHRNVAFCLHPSDASKTLSTAGRWEDHSPMDGERPWCWPGGLRHPWSAWSRFHL